MSFTNQSGDLAAFDEVVPDAARLGAPSKSSILTQRRRCRIVPQSGMSYPAGGNSQISFILADQGGLIDPRSICINYTIAVTGTSVGVCSDDGHVFTTAQVLVNGQLLDNIQNAMKLTNIEMKMGGSQSYYRSAGSFQGFELLNPDLTTTVPLAGTNSVVAQSAAWGYVANNTTDICTRQKRTGAVVFNGIAGEQRSIPLGLISGVGRMAQYIPVSLLGELQLTLITGSPGEVLFNCVDTNTDGNYSLSQVSLEYDVVVPSTPYMSLLQHIAAEDGERGGLNLPFESSIVASGGAIALSATMQESTIVTSRATNHLLRTSVVQIPSSGLQSQGTPSQSMFSHAGLYSIQWRVGSQTFPQVAASGDAAMFNMSLDAYGSVLQESGSVVNRCLWGQSSSVATPGTALVYETADAASGGTKKFCWADSCVPSYGFRTVKGASQPLDVDGISLAGASGSQLITTLVSAPGIAYTPFVSMVALKFIKAKAGAVSVVGA
jgi:hypothetical protein